MSAQRSVYFSSVTSQHAKAIGHTALHAATAGSHLRRGANEPPVATVPGTQEPSPRAAHLKLRH